MDLILPKVLFMPNREMVGIIYAAMDCSLRCTTTFGNEYRWFKDYPEVVVRHSPKYGYIYESDKPFPISIERINALYQLIKNLFPTGTFKTEYRSEYPVTITQIFRSSKNVWVSADLESFFYCEKPTLPPEYLRWAELALHHDYTYMMSDSGSTRDSGRESEERIKSEMALLDTKICTLWYNFIIKRFRTNPQDACFGINRYEPWNTLQQCYEIFGMQPQDHPMVDVVVKAPENKPCVGFPAHPKKVGWHPQDIKSNYPLAFVTKAEYLASIKQG